jgi:hypothetical protein
LSLVAVAGLLLGIETDLTITFPGCRDKSESDEALLVPESLFTTEIVEFEEENLGLSFRVSALISFDCRKIMRWFL